MQTLQTVQTLQIMQKMLSMRTMQTMYTDNLCKTYIIDIDECSTVVFGWDWVDVRWGVSKKHLTSTVLIKRLSAIKG